MSEQLGRAIWQLSAVELIAAYRRRELSPVEVADDLLARLERFNPILRAYLSVDEPGIRQAAARAEAAWLRDEAGPLCGVPVSVKDTIEMAGLPTTYGSAVFKGNYQADAEVVRRLRAAGAVLVGKTNTPEFALATEVRNALGPDGRNPWDFARTCGGSSGGAAAAVAAGLGPSAVGTDSAGSIRLPAAYNGVFGVKPSFQRIPAVQQWRASPTRSHNGPISRTVADAALLLSVTAGPHVGDQSSRAFGPMSPTVPALGPPQGTIGVVVGGDASTGQDSAPGRAALAEVTLELADHGYDLVEIPAARILERPDSGHGLGGDRMTYGGDHVAAAEALDPDFFAHEAELMDYARPLYERGRTLLAREFRRGARTDEALGARVAALLEEHQFVVTQIADVAPPIADARDRHFPLLSCINHARNPAASVPVAWSKGLPIGVQVIGRFGADAELLSVCAYLEARLSRLDLWPPSVAGEGVSV